MSQIRQANPGPEQTRGPSSAGQLLMGRRQRRAAKLALGLRGELATPERITNCCDVGPTMLAMRASTSSFTSPQSNPGWMLGLGAGLVGAAAGAFANCWPRVVTQMTHTTPDGRQMSLRIRIAPCSTSERFEATVTPRADAGMSTDIAGPMRFRRYEDAVKWADTQSGLSWNTLLQPPKVMVAQVVNPPSAMRPARAGARANISAAMNPSRVWPPASAHSPFAPLPPRWFYYQSPSTAGAPEAPGIPVAAPGPPPGVWGRGNLCYDDRDCRRDEYCHGGACVRAPWGNPPTSNPAQMQSLTVPLAPGFG